MLFAAFIVTFICLLAVARAGNLYFDDEVLMKDMWATFKKDWRKEYASPEEENKRYGIFLENLKLADQRNWEERLEGGDATHGVTKFMDIHVDDFKARFRNADSSLRSTEDAIEATITAEPVEDAKVVDWSGKYTTAVKDQGECGSCWAFSVTEQIESDMIRQHGKRHVLSPQQLVDCDQHGGGCKGGFTDQGYRYVRTVGGMVKNTDYPYDSGKDGKSGTCDLDIDEAVVTVKDYFTLADEKKMSSYMQSTGPISVCIDAAKWQTYNGGVLRSCGKKVDHCVQATGIKASKESGWWKIRNSWGSDWGEAGYIRIGYGYDCCGITDSATYSSTRLVHYTADDDDKNADDQSRRDDK